jgi:hypothetical protein
MLFIEEQTEQVGRISRLDICQASAHSQQDGKRRLQDEAEVFGPGEPLRRFLEELP